MKTRIVCHRGACRHAPENTIAGGLAAARLGGDIVELDVRQSRDGVLYVLHDAALDRTSDGSGLIADTDSSELDRLDAGSWFAPQFAGEPLPRLDDFIAALKGRLDFYIEVKQADPPAVAAAVRRGGIAARCFAYSESATVRAGLRAAAPWLKRMINWRDVDTPAEATADGAQILEFHAGDFRPERLAEARALGLEIMVHTPLRDVAVFRAAFDAGVDYLNMDFPDLAFRLRDEPP